MTEKTPMARILLTALFVALALVLVPAALADKGGNGGGKSGTKGGSTTTTTSSSSSLTSSSSTAGCAVSAPGVSIDNNYAWGSPGSYGLPGQQLTYAIKVTNNDAGCSSSSFVVSVSAPTGFAVSLPTTTITLKSTSSGYLYAYVTSPSVVADGTYALSAAVARAGTSTAAPQATTGNDYLVYSSDTVAPTLFYSNPWDGATLSGKSYQVAVSSSDDHAVQKIALYIDGNYTTTSSCSDISYVCQLFYKWSLNRVHGQHTITFKSWDWMGNVGVLTVSFTVS